MIWIYCATLIGGWLACTSAGLCTIQLITQHTRDSGDSDGAVLCYLSGVDMPGPIPLQGTSSLESWRGDLFLRNCDVSN